MIKDQSNLKSKLNQNVVKCSIDGPELFETL